jgi:Cu(I)/Ag(I) efflux system membrane protein CusA/SilA
MISGVIAWSARNIVLVLFVTLFAMMAGGVAVTRMQVDAIPDLSDTQVIVATNVPGQAPQVVEDQVTFPLVSSLLNVPRARVVRGFSLFGVSFVYVIFEDGTDLYWARSRVLEYLSAKGNRLPEGVVPTLGPDATGVGWVYQYALNGGNQNLGELRSLQDWQLRFGLARAAGVAEIASVGGFVKQYAIIVDPLLLKQAGLTLGQVRDAVRTSNRDVGGRTIEVGETEYMIRGRHRRHRKNRTQVSGWNAGALARCGAHRTLAG